MTDVSSPAGAPPPVLRPHLPLGVVVAIACAATFMVILDTTIVNVALPAMRDDLHLSTGSQQWVVDAYLLTFGGLLLLAARAGDLFGRRAVFQAGLVVFTLGSLVGGLAENGTMLLVARAVQGVGAAALAPSSLSLILASQHEPRQRDRAMALWGVTAVSSGAIGVVLGGLLTEVLSWRWVLFVNVPIGVVLSVAVALCLLPARPVDGRGRLDLPGTVTVTAGLALLIYGISRATEIGWGSAGVIGSLIAAGFLLAGFVAIEATSAQPLVRLDIFRLPNLRIANLLALGLGTCMTGPLFFLSLYLQQLLGYSALRAGLALLPMAIAMAVGTIAGRLLLGAGVKHIPVQGGVIGAVALLWLTQIPAHPAYLTHLLGPTLILGAGISVMLLPMTVAATAGVPHQDAGLASGLINVSRQIGGAVGLAVLVSVAGSAASGASGRQSTAVAATLHGYHVAFLVMAGISLLTAAGAAFLRLEPATPDPATPDPATSEPAAPELATPDPATPDPATSEPAAPELATPELATPELA